jgi:RsiW-degrading membrane proteinase PrsW (M82 family)
MDFVFIIYVILGLLPSLTWLSFYLKEDMHPEPKRMILRIFLWGALVTIPVIFVQVGLAYLLKLTNLIPIISDIIYWFLIIAFSEEFFKYLVVRLKVFDSPHLDEPLDIMLYMVVSALGFAAVENIAYLFGSTGAMSLNQILFRTLLLTYVRFIGATFLHTLCSAIIGYSLAFSFYHTKTRYELFLGGLILAVLLHGLYDFALSTQHGYMQFAVPASIIGIIAILVMLGFEKVKKMKSVCKI